MNWHNIGVFMTVVIMVLLVGILVLIFVFEKDHPCIEFVPVCQEEHTVSTIVMAGKTAVPLVQTSYRDVSCDGEYDRVIKRCSKRS